MSLLRHSLFLALLLSSSVAIVAAEGDDDVDRTDFSDPSVDSSLDKKKAVLGASPDIEPSSMIVEPIGESLPIGVPSYLLVSLANVGVNSKIYFVSKINGVVKDIKTGEAVANFSKLEFEEKSDDGKILPREQKSFRFPFKPKKTLSPGEYQLVFSVFYHNREKEAFSAVVYDEKAVLVPGPREPTPMPDLSNVALGVALVLGLAIAYTQMMPAAKSAPKDASKPEEPAQWLPNNGDVVSANSPTKKKKGAKRG